MKYFSVTSMNEIVGQKSSGM